MTIHAPEVGGSDDLEQALCDQIEQETNGRARRIRIAVRPDRIVVLGEVSSYYVKQLTLEAILKITRPRKTRVDLKIRVRDQPQSHMLAASPV